MMRPYWALAVVLTHMRAEGDVVNYPVTREKREDRANEIERSHIEVSKKIVFQWGSSDPSMFEKFDGGKINGNKLGYTFRNIYSPRPSPEHSRTLARLALPPKCLHIFALTVCHLP